MYVLTHEVVELAVDITADGHRARHPLDTRLLHENLPRLLAKQLHIFLLELRGEGEGEEGEEKG